MATERFWYARPMCLTYLRKVEISLRARLRWGMDEEEDGEWIREMQLTHGFRLVCVVFTCYPCQLPVAGMRPGQLEGNVSTMR